MFCPSCGNLIDNDSVYCPYCGTPLAREGRATTAQQDDTWGAGKPMRATTQIITDTGAAGDADPWQGVPQPWEEPQQVPQQVPQASQQPSQPSQASGMRNALIAVAAVAALAALVIGGFFLLRKPSVGPEQLVGYLAVTEKADGGDYAEKIAIEVDGDGEAHVMIAGYHVVGTIVKDGEFNGSIQYGLDNPHNSSGASLEGLAITLAAPRGASQGERVGVWAICVEDTREGHAYLQSDIAVINEDNTATYQILKDKNCFDGSWKKPEKTRQTWTKIDPNVYSFVTTETGYVREVAFPGDLTE